jgi:ABC-type nitrate/sulfonate/bicarbonate transport system permease component
VELSRWQWAGVIIAAVVGIFHGLYLALVDRVNELLDLDHS